ncbi:glycosyltransferase [Flocculibacter collagenilyticus]|uniref:glycosyltransferase n=1 Tax=Flocculibacter collagenilyticus TaxID=2744479 RepID=UPI0018F6AA7A|nr:glycosyltransferase [Flocculibacter collagenilyticus]
MKKPGSVLYVAYHYPPILVSSGVHRTLAFTRHLANAGWDVTVLTASVKGYDNWSEKQFSLIPNDINVIRAFCRNTAKSFSLFGKYSYWMALPDNWQSWIVGGVISGLNHIRKNKPDVIVSTYPLASAMIIGYILHKLTGIPWVADFRDPMAQENYPTDKRKKKIFQWIESKIIKHCSCAFVTAPGAKVFYENKYPHVPSDFWNVIPNGYDHELMQLFNVIADEHSSDKKTSESDVAKKITMLHSGVIYPNERDPSFLFKAIANLRARSLIDKDNFELKLRAPGNEKLIQNLVDKAGVDELVSVLSPIDYQSALTEMMESDVLLVMQADNCDYQIPAKTYEYICMKKPILGLTSERGDTGKLLLQTGHAMLAPLTNTDKIQQRLEELLISVKQSQFKFLENNEIYKYSRQYHAGIFHEQLTQIVE